MKLRATVTSTALLLTGCGYVGDTRPPSLQLPLPASDLVALERGDKIVVQFTAPTRTTEDLPVRARPSFVIYIGGKPFEIPGAEGTVTAELDAKPFYGQDVKVAVKALNDRKRDAGFSNQVSLRVIPALARPANVRAVAVAEGVQVSWESPEKLFTIFRQGPAESKLVKLGTAEASPFLDKDTEYGKEYRYAVQAAAGAAESEISEMAKPMIPVDRFAPAAPQGLVAVVATASVELVWDRDTETDLAGYRIYRDGGSGQFEKIGESHDTPTFSDKKAEAGKKYRYAVTAYDRAGNESQLSEPAEAIIP